MGKFLLFFFLFSYVYPIHFNEVKFGVVSERTLSQKNHHLEKDADAAILYKNKKVYFNYNYNDGWQMVSEVHFRIKIYNKNGLDWATHKVLLKKSDSEEEKISNIKGYTFNLFNKEVIRDKLKNNAIFFLEVNNFLSEVSIAMPKAKSGSVLDIQYRITSPHAGFMDEMRLQHNIPTDKVDLRFDIPEFFIFNRYIKGNHKIKFQEFSKQRSVHISYRDVDRATGLSSTRNKFGKLEYTENVLEAEVTQIPSLNYEENLSNPENYRSAISFELAATRFSNEPPKKYSLSWEDVAKSIYEKGKLGKKFEKITYFKNDIDSLINMVPIQQSKLNVIFDFYKRRMVWNGRTGLECNDELQEVYSSRSGNIAELNLILIAILQYSGFNASPIVLSTRSNGIPLYPTLDGFNYIIAGIEVSEDKVLLMDASEKNSAIGILPKRVLNWTGRLIRKDSSVKQIDLTPKEFSDQLVSVSADIGNKGTIKGKLRKLITNQHALNFRNNTTKGTNKEIIDILSEEFSGIDILSYNIENENILNKPIVVDFNFELEDFIEEIGDKLFFQPMLFLSKKENPFKFEKRQNPIDFIFPHREKYVVNLKIPKTYSVESLPQDKIITLPNNSGTFNFRITNNENSIQLSVSTELKKAIYPLTYYNLLREYYKQLVAKQSEKVVLSKI